MFIEIIDWFDTLSLFVIALVGLLLFLVEYFLSNTKIVSFKVKKIILINIWQVFGVLLPVMWILRVSDNYFQLLLPGIMIIFFGVIKPTRLKKEQDTMNQGEQWG